MRPVWLILLAACMAVIVSCERPEVPDEPMPDDCDSATIDCFITIPEWED